MSEEEIQDVEEVESSATEDVEAESSTEELSEATEEQATPEEQTVPYDRFKEVNDERNLLLQRIAQQPQQVQTQQPEIDPDANLDPQTKVFYQELDKRTQKAIDRAREEERVQYQSQLDALALQSAKFQEKIFRDTQKDVLPGSKEEVEIAGLIRAGIDPDRAAWAVMGPKRVESAKTGKVVKQQKKVQQKAQANLETAGVAADNGIPSQEKKLSFRQKLDQNMKNAGL